MTLTQDKRLHEGGPTAKEADSERRTRYGLQSTTLQDVLCAQYDLLSGTYWVGREFEAEMDEDLDWHFNSELTALSGGFPHTFRFTYDSRRGDRFLWCTRCPRPLA